MAFLDENGLAHFYQALEGKFVKQGDSGGITSKITEGSYTGNVPDTLETWDEIINANGQVVRIDLTSSILTPAAIDRIEIVGMKSLTILVSYTLGHDDITTMRGVTFYCDSDNAIGVAFTSQVYVDLTVINGSDSYLRLDWIEGCPRGFVPYDVAFTSLIPDYAYAMSNVAGKRYNCKIYYHEEVS